MDLDACNAHPSPQDQYHYHGVPYFITDELDTDGEHSVLIGYLLDGFPIYGPQDEDGEAPTDLDECNGHFGPTPEFPDGVYHYHTTETAPFVPSCYSGEVSTGGGGVVNLFGGGQQQINSAETVNIVPPAADQPQQRPPRRQRP